MSALAVTAAALFGWQVTAAATPDESTQSIQGPKRVAITTIVSYRMEALRQLQEGRATVTVEINRKGKVDRCTIATSSGSPALDKATCASVRQ